MHINVFVHFFPANHIYTRVYIINCILLSTMIITPLRNWPRETRHNFSKHSADKWYSDGGPWNYILLNARYKSEIVITPPKVVAAVVIVV